MKKIITIAIAIMMALSLTSCGKDKPVKQADGRVFTSEQVQAEETLHQKYEDGEISLSELWTGIYEIYD